MDRPLIVEDGDVELAAIRRECQELRRTGRSRYRRGDLVDRRVDDGDELSIPVGDVGCRPFGDTATKSGVLPTWIGVPRAGMATSGPMVAGAVAGAGCADEAPRDGDVQS